MQRQQVWHRALAAGLIVLLVGVSVLPVATHAQLFDDPFCDPRPGAADLHGDAADHTLHLAGASIGDTAQHCDVCHWLRSMRVFDPQPAIVLEPAADATVVHAAPVGHPDVAVAVSLAARAPPA